MRSSQTGAPPRGASEAGRPPFEALEPAAVDRDAPRRVAALAVEVRQALEDRRRALETEVRLALARIDRGN